MDEEVEASPVAKRTPWPIGLHSVEERRKKEEEEREHETLLRRGGRRKKKSVSMSRSNSCSGENHSRTSWSSFGSRSCWNSNGSSSSGASSWKSSSNCHRIARASLNRHCRKGPMPGSVDGP